MNENQSIFLSKRFKCMSAMSNYDWLRRAVYFLIKLIFWDLYLLYLYIVMHIKRFVLCNRGCDSTEQSWGTIWQGARAQSVVWVTTSPCHSYHYTANKLAPLYFTIQCIFLRVTEQQCMCISFLQSMHCTIVYCTGLDGGSPVQCNVTTCSEQ